MAEYHPTYPPTSSPIYVGLFVFGSHHQEMSKVNVLDRQGGRHGYLFWACFDHNQATKIVISNNIILWNGNNTETP